MKPSSISEPAPATGKHYRSRITLAERAQIAAQERTIGLEQARAHCNLARFELGGNQFQLFRSGGFNDPELVALVVSHLGSVFKGFSIGLFFTDNDGTTFVHAMVAAAGAIHSSSLYQPAKTALELFKLCFNIKEGRMEMSHIESKILGKGGQALIALYNIAREYGAKIIKYDVRAANRPAQCLYANLGFGTPNSWRNQWIVKIIP